MELVLYPDPILKKRAAPLQTIDDEVRSRVKEMFELMYEENGVGLAAPQVGWSVRLFVMNPAGPDEPGQQRVLINPRILSVSGSETDEEGCLSIPEVKGQVERKTRIEIEAQDLRGELFRGVFEDLPARVIQHENDHLDGILFISRLARSAQLGIKKALRELENEYRDKLAEGR